MSVSPIVSWLLSMSVRSILVGERVKPQDRCVLKDDGFYVYGTFEPADGPVHAPAHGALRTIPPCPDAYDCGPHKPPSHVPTANAYL